MKNLLLNSLLALCCILPPYLISGSKARADDWGCQVILCLSNPGGSTEYAQCRPPIQKLWRELAEGRSFPTCSGLGFHSNRPGYEPHYCDAGYTLSGGYGPRGEDATCVSTSLQRVNNTLCSNGRDGYDTDTNKVLSPHWQREGGGPQCMAYPIERPNVRSQPHYVDVTIDGVGKQRVWY
jgi:hypothetical protein